MQCTRPVWLDKEKLFVPCGKCRACRISRSREWAVRIIHEASCHDGSIFTTLTYDDENLPGNGELVKKDLQDFLKRLRRDLEPRKVRYFGVGEYGDQYGRPHYHVLIFGLSIDDPATHALVSENWNKGRIHIGTVTYDSARYCADYIQKKLYGKAADDDGRVQPFKIASLGLGKEWALANRDQLFQQMTCTLHGVNVGMPRYYRKLLDLPSGDHAFKIRELEEADKATDPLYKYRSFWQTDKNLEAKAQLYPKGNQ